MEPGARRLVAELQDDGVAVDERGGSFHTGIAIGKFHGVIRPTTPSGRRECSTCSAPARRSVSESEVRAISFTGSVPVGQRRRDEATSAQLPRPARAQQARPDRHRRRRARPRRRSRLRRRVLVGGTQVRGADRRMLVAGHGLRRVPGAAGRAGRRAGRSATRPIPRWRLGRTSTRSRSRRCSTAIERRGDGGTVLAGGERADDEGCLIAPTVIEGLRRRGGASCEEVFGPVTSLYRYSALDEAIERANAVALRALRRDLHARSPRGARALRARSRPGSIHVNSQKRAPTAGALAGRGLGLGAARAGREAIEFYTEIVTVSRTRRLALSGHRTPRDRRPRVPRRLDGQGCSSSVGGEARRRRPRCDERATAARPVGTSARGSTLVSGDVTDREASARRSTSTAVTNVVDFAALQVFHADPDVGARVNVLGTLVVFEAVEGAARPDPGLAYASRQRCTTPPIPPLHPRAGGTAPSTLYGGTSSRTRERRASTGTTTASASIGIRRYVWSTGRVRDQGITSGPSLGDGGCRSWQREYDRVRRNRAVRLPRDRPRRRPRGACCGRSPRRTPQACRDDGGGRRRDRGPRALVSRPDTSATRAPFPETLEGNLLERLIGSVPRTPLAEGVRATIEHFPRSLMTREGLVGSRGAC